MRSSPQTRLQVDKIFSTKDNGQLVFIFVLGLNVQIPAVRYPRAQPQEIYRAWGVVIDLGCAL